MKRKIAAFCLITLFFATFLTPIAVSKTNLVSDFYVESYSKNKIILALVFGVLEGDINDTVSIGSKKSDFIMSNVAIQGNVGDYVGWHFFVVQGILRSKTYIRDELVSINIDILIGMIVDIESDEGGPCTYIEGIAIGVNGV